MTEQPINSRQLTPTNQNSKESDMTDLNAMLTFLKSTESTESNQPTTEDKHNPVTNHKGHHQHVEPVKVHEGYHQCVDPLTNIKEDDNMSNPLTHNKEDDSMSNPLTNIKEDDNMSNPLTNIKEGVSMPELSISNVEFLTTIFGEDHMDSAHVVAFAGEPNDGSWGGGLAGKILAGFRPHQNQYYTISVFNRDAVGAVNRRAANFAATFVIVADDVGEKIPVEQMDRVPEPTYKLETSAGSEQWGWVLTEPCTDAAKIDAMMIGLGEQGLSDKGMKGTTRYARLPEGSNGKASKLVDGKPYKCQLIHWEPELMYGLDELAEALGVDLTVNRKVVRATAGVEMPDHPIWGSVVVTESANEGWMRIDCPNAAEHSDRDPAGAAIRTLAGGAVQFKCHHEHCQRLNGEKLVDMLGITAEVELYAESISDAGNAALKEIFGDEVEKYGSKGEREDEFKPLEVMVGRGGVKLDPKNYIFLNNENKFYCYRTGNSISPSGLDNRYLSVVPREKGKATTDLLRSNATPDDDADGVTWYPKGLKKPSRSEIFMQTKKGKMINEWSGLILPPEEGGDCDATPWLEHAEYLIPNKAERDVVLDYLACVLQKIEQKPAFWLIHKGGYRVGKDTLYRPLVMIFGEPAVKLLKLKQVYDGWGDFLRGLKFAIITEVDKVQDRKAANAMKEFCAPNSSEYRTLNIKGASPILQYDALAGVMMSNKEYCMTIEDGDERYFVVDSKVVRRSDSYYIKLREWIDNGGAQKVCNYLMKRDISKFNMHALPFKTEAMKKLVEGSRYDYEQDMIDDVASQDGIFARDFFTQKELKAHARREGWKCGNNGLKEAVEKCGYIKKRVQKRGDNQTRSLGDYWIKKELLNVATLSDIFDTIESGMSGFMRLIPK